MPGVGFDVFTVACNTSTGTQALTGDCGGKTPKAAIVIVTRTTTLGTISDNAMMSIGLTDGTNTFCVSCASEDGQAVASYNTGRRTEARLGDILATPDGVGAPTDGFFTFSSFSADTLTIDIASDPPATAVQLLVILFYGDDLEVKADALALSAAVNGTAPYSSLSFRPRALFGIHGIAAASNGLHARLSCGVCTFDDDADGTKRQLSWAFTDRDTPTTNKRVSQNVRNDAFVQRLLNLDNGNMTETAWYDVTVQSSNGFTVTTRNEALGGPLYFLAFRFGSSRTWCGFPAFASSSTATQAITEPGFRPQFVMAWGTAHQEANVNVLQNTSGERVGQVTIGASDGVGNDRQAAYQTEQGAGNSDTRCLTSSKLLEVVHDDGSTSWDATLASFDATGPSIDVGTASGNDKLMGIWVVEQNRADFGWLSEAKSGSRWRRRLARM